MQIKLEILCAIPVNSERAVFNRDWRHQWKDGMWRLFKWLKEPGGRAITRYRAGVWRFTHASDASGYDV